jgi:hypothetical protein
MPVALNDRVTVAPNVVFRVLGSEAVILHLDGGLYFGLDEVGTRIWQLLETGDLAGVAGALTREYDVAAAQAATDVIAFVGRLLDLGLVQPVQNA